MALRVKEEWVRMAHRYRFQEQRDQLEPRCLRQAGAEELVLMIAQLLGRRHPEDLPRFPGQLPGLTRTPCRTWRSG